MRKKTHVAAALDTELDTALETIFGMSDVVESLIVSAKAEPGLGVSSPRGTLKVAEGPSGVVGNVFRVGTAGGKGGTEVDSLCGDDLGYARGGGELKDGGDGSLDEVGELGIGYDGRANGGVGRGG